MKKNLFWGTFAILALASCTNDEVVSIPQEEIRLSMVTNKSSRAADVYCNNNLPQSFMVSANYTAKDAQTSATYFNGDKYVAGTDGTYTNETNVRYWPNEGTLDFYAHVNAGDKFNWISGKVPTVEFTVENEVSKQKDFIYAVAKDVVKPTDGTGRTSLNFNHALSQVVFKAKNMNPKLYVEVTGVGVYNLCSAGTYTFPDKTTSGLVVKHNNDNGFNITYDGEYVRGKWSLGENPTYTQDYTVEWENAIAVPGDNEVVALTSADDTNKDGEWNSNTMLLLPQETTAWDPSKDTEKKRESGTLLSLTCKIYNVAGSEYTEGDVVLFDKTAYIPVTINWEQGKKYIYTFVFGNGDAGYDEEGNPILTPISFDIVVDDFAIVKTENVEMDTDKNTDSE